MTCPRCGSVEVDSTTIGGITFPGVERFDDANRSKCQKCRHNGGTGDWERIDKLRTALAAAEAKLAALIETAERCRDMMKFKRADRLRPFQQGSANGRAWAELNAAIARARSTTHSADPSSAPPPARNPATPPSGR